MFKASNGVKRDGGKCVAPWILTKAGMIGMACLPLYYMWRIGFHKLAFFVAAAYWMMGFVSELLGFGTEPFYTWALWISIGSALFGLLILFCGPSGRPPWERD